MLPNSFLEKKFAEALNYFEAGCSGNSPGACNNAGMLYQSGEAKANKEIDMNKAVERFTKACDIGHRMGCFNLSSIYLTGRNGVPKDFPKAFEISLKTCKLGHPWACVNVSRMYKVGDGVEQDLEKAAEFRKRAEELNRNSSQWVHLC